MARQSPHQMTLLKAGVRQLIQLQTMVKGGQRRETLAPVRRRNEREKKFRCLESWNFLSFVVPFNAEKAVLARDNRLRNKPAQQRDQHPAVTGKECASVSARGSEWHKGIYGSRIQGATRRRKTKRKSNIRDRAPFLTLFKPLLPRGPPSVVQIHQTAKSPSCKCCGDLIG